MLLVHMLLVQVWSIALHTIELYLSVATAWIRYKTYLSRIIDLTISNKNQIPV